MDEVDDASMTASDGFTVMKGALADLLADGIRLVIDGLKDLAKETITVGMNFESAMSKVQAISGASAEEMDLLSMMTQAMTTESAVGSLSGQNGVSTKQASGLVTAALPILLQAMTRTQDEEERALFMADLEGDFVSPQLIKKSYRRINGKVAKFNETFSKHECGYD